MTMAQRISKNSPDTTVIEEASVETPAGTLKPDLVVIHQGRVQVVDITVRHEDMGYLAEGHKSKIEKYAPLLPIIADKLHASPGQVLPIVIGTRGAIPKSTLSSLEALNVTDRGSYITIALISLRSSIETYHQFLDYDRSPT